MSLAILGGEPVRSALLPYGTQWIDEEDIEAVAQVLRSPLITQGPVVDAFAEAVAGYCGARFAVPFSSGTAALHAACAVAGLGPGDEAITTPLTFVATANAIVYCGATPVLADIREDTLTLDPLEVRRKLTSKTRAILPVDFAGHPSNADEIRDIARENGLVVIEDAAHALGARYKGRKVGTLADMTAFSFHPVKQITTGEGGMILTDRPDFYQKLKRFQHHGIMRDVGETAWPYEISEIGHNYRITDFQCALGLSQLKKLDRFITRRLEIAKRYHEAFRGMPEILPPVEADWASPAYHLYVVQLGLHQLATRRREIFEALCAENVGVQVHYKPVHLFRYFSERYGYRRGDFPRAEAYFERALSLPIFPKMDDGDVRDVIAALRKVLAHYAS